MNNSGFGYTITCHFSKSKSWVLHKTDHILAHEQGHFDIAEVFARKLNKQMSSYVFNKNTYKTELRNIYQGILDEKEALQNQYDAETNHSINKEKQAEWLIKIQTMLEEYKGYAGY
jgi:predicted secreted Zn-dependent protease